MNQSQLEKLQRELKSGQHYLLKNPDHNSDSCVAYYYFSEDSNAWGFGFNVADGGGFLPLSHSLDSMVVEELSWTTTGQTWGEEFTLEDAIKKYGWTWPMTTDQESRVGEGEPALLQCTLDVHCPNLVKRGELFFGGSTFAEKHFRLVCTKSNFLAYAQDEKNLLLLEAAAEFKNQWPKLVGVDCCGIYKESNLVALDCCGIYKESNSSWVVCGNELATKATNKLITKEDFELFVRHRALAHYNQQWPDARLSFLLIEESTGKFFLKDNTMQEGFSFLMEKGEFIAMLDKKEDWERGEALPPVGECEVVCDSTNRYQKINVLAHEGDRAIFRWLDGPRKDLLESRKNGVFGGNGSAEYVVFRKTQKATKTIDMNLFLGTKFLLVHNETRKLGLAIKAKKDLSGYKPRFGFFNDWQGTKKPDFLEGFKFQVKAFSPTGLFISAYEGDSGGFDWEFVTSISITGIEEGYEL